MNFKSIRRRFILTAFLPPLALFVIVTAICYFVDISNIAFPLFAIAAVTYINVIRRREAKRVPKDLLFTDPEAFGSYVKLLNFGKTSPLIRAIVEYYSGNHKRSAEIAVSSLKGKLNDYNRYMYLCRLILIYYQRNDFDKMRQIFDKSLELLNKSGNTEATKKEFPYLNFFEKYLNGDIDGAIESYKEYWNNIPQSQATDADEYERCLRLGIAYYNKGDTETAKQYFSKLASGCPNAHYRSVGEKYLYAIDLCDPSILAEPELLPSEDGIRAERSKARKRKAAIVGIIAVLAIAFVLMMTFLPDKTQNDEYSKAFEEMSELAEEKLPSLEPLGLIQVEAEEGNFESICVFKSPSGTVEVYSWCAYKDTGEKFFMRIANEIKIDKSVEGKSAFYNYSYSFLLTADSDPELTGVIGRVKIKLDNETVYLFISRYNG